MLKAASLRVGVEFGEGLGHAVEAHGVELIEGWMMQQGRLSFSGNIQIRGC
jgi:hypothetical protein